MSRIFTRLNLGLLAALAAVTIAGFWFLPADRPLPLHWNWHGIVDAWGSRERTLLLLPLKGTAKRKRRKTDMFEPKATAPHLDSTKAGNALTERNISA